MLNSISDYFISWLCKLLSVYVKTLSYLLFFLSWILSFTAGHLAVA